MCIWVRHHSIEEGYKLPYFHKESHRETAAGRRSLSRHTCESRVTSAGGGRGSNYAGQVRRAPPRPILL